MVKFYRYDGSNIANFIYHKLSVNRGTNSEIFTLTRTPMANPSKYYMIISYNYVGDESDASLSTQLLMNSPGIFKIKLVVHVIL